MKSSRADILIHPVRSRILVVVAGRQVTARQIGEALPDVSPATLYRHLGKLCEAGVLKVVKETPVRGTIEKEYAFARETAELSEEDWRGFSREDHLHYFQAYMASILGEFRAYLQQENVDFLADGWGYRSIPVHVSREEVEELAAQIRALLLKAMANPLTPERRRLLVHLISIPERRDIPHPRPLSDPERGELG